MSNEKSAPVVTRKYLPIFIMLTSCFALWGLLNNMTDHLVPAFQKIFDLPQSTAVLVQVSFYGSYSVLAVFASVLIQRLGYRKGVLWGLGVYIIGAVLYVPACLAQSFWLYIAGIFVVAGGCAVLETTCNPYILALGDDSTAVRRLNFAQMFNPVGSIIGILLAQQLILSNLNPATTEQRQAMDPAQLKDIVNHELFWVCVPYVGLCVIAAGIWFFFFRSKASEVDRSEEDNVDYGTIFRILAHSPKWYLGVVAQVFYVGVQIAAWTYINLYGQYEFGLTKEAAANYYLLSILVFIVCRWIATFCMKYVDPAKLMALFAAGAIVCTAGVMYLPSNILFSVGALPFSWNVICFVLMSGCMSLMFPTIYGIALGGIDKRAHKAGAAGLIMAIVGGAILTYWMAGIISSQMTGLGISAKAPVVIADGSSVQKGEMCALVWTADGAFEGFRAETAERDGKPVTSLKTVDPADIIVWRTKIAEPGAPIEAEVQCPVDPAKGTWGFYLVDTRVDGELPAGDVFEVSGCKPLVMPELSVNSPASPSFWLKLMPSKFASEPNGELGASQASLRASFVVPAICFAVVLLYALFFRARKKNED